MAISMKVRRALGEAAQQISAKIWPNLGEPIDAMKAALSAQGYDPAIMDGIYCGEKGQDVQRLEAGKDEHLIFQWWKFSETGRFEVNIYIS
jgi:hypothetical protein